MQVTQSITLKQSQLRRSERKVADFVLSHPEEVIRLRITDLARDAGVSEPTVIRFCRDFQDLCRWSWPLIRVYFNSTSRRLRISQAALLVKANAIMP